MESSGCETTKLPFERFVSKNCQLAYFKGEEDNLEEAIDGRCEPCQAILDGNVKQERRNSNAAEQKEKEMDDGMSKKPEKQNQDTQTEDIYFSAPITMTEFLIDPLAPNSGSETATMFILGSSNMETTEKTNQNVCDKTIVPNNLDFNIETPPPSGAGGGGGGRGEPVYFAKKSAAIEDRDIDAENIFAIDTEEMEDPDQIVRKTCTMTCRICDRSFTTKSACYSHERRVHFVGYFKCGNCHDHVSETIFDFAVHVTSAHPQGI